MGIVNGIQFPYKLKRSSKRYSFLIYIIRSVTNNMQQNKTSLIYFATLSSHLSIKIMVNIEMEHATTNNDQVIQIGIVS